MKIAMAYQKNLYATSNFLCHNSFMQTKTYRYISNRPIVQQINPALYKNKEMILIQIFCGEGEKRLQRIAAELCEVLPQAHIIGTTTDGEIDQEEITTHQSIIAVSVFERTCLKSGYVQGEDDYDNGVTLARRLIDSDTKLLILFSDGTSCNGERFLQGVGSVDASVRIAGGMAGDNGRFLQTFVLHGEHLIPRGAVGVALSGEALHVYNDFSFNWSPVGIEHVIDEVEHNRVYRIDGISAVDFYAKYLGEEVADALPATGIEFPLIIEREGRKIGRAAIARHADDSLSFAGNLRKGERVRLGFGNAEMIMRESMTSFAASYPWQVESFFVYACMARRRYMPEFIQMEIHPYAETAPTAGFFTYGEFFYRDGRHYLMNQTLTAVALSEASEILRSDIGASIPENGGYSDFVSTVRALTHLIEQSTRDYEEQAQKLEAQRRYSQNLLASQRLFLRHAVHESNTPLSVMMSNIELFELEYGKNPYLSNIEAALKNLYGIYDDLSYLVRKEQVDYPPQDIELRDYLRSRIEFFEIVAKQSGSIFDVQYGDDPLWLKINETKLQRIVDNNLTNAIKYTLEGEKIIVTLTKMREGIKFEVASRSVPIRDPEKIFEAYYREIPAKEGLGIGLSLVRMICEEEGIKITLDSTKERTSFCYLFPHGDAL